MKKFIISSDLLKKALNKLNNAVAKNSVLPVLSNILCKVTEGSVELISTDLEVTIQYRCECETTSEGFEFLLPYHLIHKIVGFSRNTTLTFIEQKKGIKLMGDNDVYDISASGKISEFPALPKIKNPAPISLENDVLDLMVNALKTVSKDEMRPQLTKVLLEVRKDAITIASTDGSFMVFSYSLPAQTESEADLLISEKVIKSLEGVTDISLAWNDKNMVFESLDITVTITRPDLKFVNFRAIFPADYPSNITFTRSDLILALEKCNINTDPFKQTTINLKKKEGKIELLASDSSINIKLELDGQYTGTAEEIKLSSDKLMKLVSQVDFEKIDLAIHEPNKPVLLRSADHPGYVSLLMPIHSA